jgi:hypothetical protein
VEQPCDLLDIAREDHRDEQVTTELCRTPGDIVLTCLRDLDVMDEPLEAASASPPIQHFSSRAALSLAGA